MRFMNITKNRKTNCLNKMFKMRRNSDNSRCWMRAISIGLLFQIIANCDLASAALGNVTLTLEPPTVRRGQQATLKCTCDLGGAPLYSVKFYRGLREFYRYSPGTNPTNKTFPYPGINVDTSLSNASQVVIRNVGFGLSGNFSCEVTADAPSFSTRTGYVVMQVVELPEKPPEIHVEHSRYESGDILRGNCSSQASRPRVELTPTINNMLFHNVEHSYLQTNDNLVISSINFHVNLQDAHFQAIQNSVNGIAVRCTADIANLYQSSSELELTTQPRDPIPARVTSNTGTTAPHVSPIIFIILFGIIYIRFIIHS